MAYKYKLKEQERKNTLKPKDVSPNLLKRLEDLYGPIDVERDFFSANLDTYYKTKSVDKETGTVGHKVIPLASFEESLRKITSAYEALKDLLKADEAKNDSNIQDVSRDIKVALNKYRAHLRKFYPEQYRQAIARIDEDLEEVSTSGAAGAYLTPYAFRKKGQKPNDKAYKELGYKKVNEDINLVHVINKEGVKYGTTVITDGVPAQAVICFDGSNTTVQPTDTFQAINTPSDPGPTIIREGTCGYDRDVNGKKLKGPGGLGEAISLDIEDDIAYLSGDSGEYEGEIEDGKVSFSVIYDDLDYRISDQYNENNIEDFLGKGHAFVELAKKYDHNWGIERDLVGITIKLKDKLNEGDTYEKMAAKGKKAGNLKQGTVRKRLNIPKGKKIPLSKINKEISRIKKMENPSEKNKKYLKALNLSKTLKTTTNVDEGSNNPGASLGPGPKAGPDGVSNSAYTKQFKYKLVPKTKDGTYVQKGSGMIVKNLF